MPLACNIDSRGKRARLISGIVFLVIAVGLATWGWSNGSMWLWIVVGIAGLSGVFSIFEARAGWCAIRAMGFRTPL
jgi:hypothetical protein